MKNYSLHLNKVVVKFIQMNVRKFVDEVVMKYAMKLWWSMRWSCDEVLYQNCCESLLMKFYIKIVVRVCWWSSISKLLWWSMRWSYVANLSLNLSWWDSWIISHTIYHESFVKGLWWICIESLLKVCCDKAEMKAVKDVLKYVE